MNVKSNKRKGKFKICNNFSNKVTYFNVFSKYNRNLSKFYEIYINFNI